MPLGRLKMGTPSFMENDEFAAPGFGSQGNMPQFPSLLPGLDRFMQRRGLNSPAMPSGLQRFMMRRGVYQGMGGPMDGVPVQEINPQPVAQAVPEKPRGGIKEFIANKLGRK